ncbi:cupin domain-containing protein [Klebsiella grimontii]|uniref:cupin domain-containing protein n=1 Tax=Klebsiella grimontii TaxID=2058152 RepID=UPI001CCF3BFC|nr:cupin domain-containing protein [Klebsiella grimontii]
MVKNENQFIRIDTNDRSNWHRMIQRDICPLYSDDMEAVALIKLAPGERLFCSPLSGGAEILLLEGEMTGTKDIYTKGSWLRFPPGDMPTLIAYTRGAKLYLKTGHLNLATSTGVFP